jgi:peptidoglycan hydrolase-like protein with peptidoglycan-binding domain
VPSSARRSVAVDPRELSAEGGWLRAIVRRILRNRPSDLVAAAVAIVGALSIMINALFLQTGPHPAPLFGGKRPVADGAGSSVVTILPRPRPATSEAAKPDPAAARARAQLISDIQRELSKRGFYDGPIDGIYGAKMDAAIRDFEHAAGLKPSVEPGETLLAAIVRSTVKASPPVPAGAKRDPIADLLAPSQRVLAVQRALSDYGYGPLQSTGVFDPSTRAAIEKFERERGLPAAGQISERLVRELEVMTGRPLE